LLTKEENKLPKSVRTNKWNLCQKYTNQDLQKKERVREYKKLEIYRFRGI
jgi:hypothetical protein